MADQRPGRVTVRRGPYARVAEGLRRMEPRFESRSRWTRSGGGVARDVKPHTTCREARALVLAVPLGQSHDPLYRIRPCLGVSD